MPLKRSAFAGPRINPRFGSTRVSVGPDLFARIETSLQLVERAEDIYLEMVRPQVRYTGFSGNGTGQLSSVLERVRLWW
jgi:hypothetical protein